MKREEGRVKSEEWEGLRILHGNGGFFMATKKETGHCSVSLFVIPPFNEWRSMFFNHPQTI
jgi:hypothetical protein